VVQQRVDPTCAGGCRNGEIGHAASAQGMSVAEVVANRETGHLRGDMPARLVHCEELRGVLAERSRAVVPATKGGGCHRVAQYTGGDRVTLRMIGIEETFGRRSLADLRELPAEIRRILQTDVEALSAD